MAAYDMGNAYEKHQRREKKAREARASTATLTLFDEHEQGKDIPF